MFIDICKDLNSFCCLCCHVSCRLRQRSTSFNTFSYLLYRFICSDLEVCAALRTLLRSFFMHLMTHAAACVIKCMKKDRSWFILTPSRSSSKVRVIGRGLWLVLGLELFTLLGATSWPLLSRPFENLNSVMSCQTSSYCWDVIGRNLSTWAIFEGGGSLRSPILGGRGRLPPTTLRGRKLQGLPFHVV